MVWPTKVLEVLPVLRSQSLRVLSHEEERQNKLSAERAISETKWLWPVRDFKGTP